MVVTKMKQAQIKCREYYCWSLTCGIKKKKKKKDVKQYVHLQKGLETKETVILMKNTARHWTLKLKKKSKNLWNITSIMGYYPRNGQIGDTEPALNTAY